MTDRYPEAIMIAINDEVVLACDERQVGRVKALGATTWGTAGLVLIRWESNGALEWIERRSIRCAH